MGTLDRYARRVAKSRYSPPTPEVADHISTVVGLFRKRQEIEVEYREALAKLAGPDGDRVPIAYIAEQLGVERKTVYRHLGRSMT